MGKKESKKKIKSEQTTKAASVQDENTLSVEDQYKVDLEQEKDKFLRLFAEFENYKRRTARRTFTNLDRTSLYGIDDHPRYR